MAAMRKFMSFLKTTRSLSTVAGYRVMKDRNKIRYEVIDFSVVPAFSMA